MFHKLTDTLTYHVSDFENAKKVEAQIMEDNRKFAVIWAGVLAGYWSFCLVMSTMQDAFRQCRSIYAVAFAVCAASMLLAAFAAPKKPALIRPIAVAIDCSFLWAGVGIAVHLAPQTIVIFAAVVMVPVLFICDMLSTITLILIDIMVFSIVGSLKMDAAIFRWTIMNMVIFASGGIVVGYYVNKSRFERYHFAEAALQLAESKAKLAELQTQYAYCDQMTGLKNRRAYSELMDRLEEATPAYCCVIMADINGLKTANDTMGHPAGDELIMGSAECLRQSFEGVDAIYRLGGDEFCVILTCSEPDVLQYLKRLEALCAGWQGQYIKGISIAYGFASTKEFTELETILRTADERMYTSKDEFYRKSGRYRRRH